MEKQKDGMGFQPGKVNMIVGGQGANSFSLVTARFKVGDTVRIVEEGSRREELLNTLAVITEVSKAGGYAHYSLVSIQGHGPHAWFNEEDLKLALAVEDLIKTANSKQM